MSRVRHARKAALARGGNLFADDVNRNTFRYTDVEIDLSSVVTASHQGAAPSRSSYMPRARHARKAALATAITEARVRPSLSTSLLVEDLLEETIVVNQTLVASYRTRSARMSDFDELSGDCHRLVPACVTQSVLARTAGPQTYEKDECI